MRAGQCRDGRTSARIVFVSGHHFFSPFHVALNTTTYTITLSKLFCLTKTDLPITLIKKLPKEDV